jgi:hypothetical protein
MSQPSQTSPNIENYIIGKGVVTWQLQGTTPVIDLGNCQRFEMTPKVDKLPHWNQRLGTRFKDLIVPVTKEMELVMSLDEWSYENLILALYGTLSGTTNNILDQPQLIGQIVFTGSTNVGPRKLVTLPTVALFSNGKLDLISNEWAELEVSGEVMGNPGSGVFGTMVDAP